MAETVEVGKVYIAPGGKHMIVNKDMTGKMILQMNEDPPVHSCRPAVDVLFESMVKNFTKNILSVILTGMGEDGANGVEKLKTKKCYSISQSKSSCVVYGMPQAVESRGLADEVLDAADIPRRMFN